MQLNQTSRQFNLKTAKQILLKENKFITNFFSILSIPASKSLQNSKIEEEYLLPSENVKSPQFLNAKQDRASTLVELQERLQAMKNRRLTAKEKLLRKNVKNKIKKSEKKNERNAKKKLTNIAKKTIENSNELEKNDNVINKSETKSVVPKPVFNKESKIVFSKFDFSEIGKQKKRKGKKDPKQILKELEQKNEKLKQLVEKGEAEKVALAKEKSAWKSALAKAEGQKVKDDPFLLKKSVKKQEQLKRMRGKKWEQRKEKVEKAKEERQKKRSENIQKKIEKKKAAKMKKAVKKGKIIL